MTADDVLASLRLRWPDGDHHLIEEAPQHSDRQGGAIDLLVVSVWRSRGLAIDAVEVKVSIGDARRELKAAAKADFWWRHSDRFWMAAPMDLAKKVEGDVPKTWGLLGCEAGKPAKIIVKAPARGKDREPLGWPTVVGLLRASADAGRNALFRAEQRGRERGIQEGLARAAKERGEGYLQQQLDALRQHVAEFEEAAGVDLSKSWPEAKSIGELVRIIMNERGMPGHTMTHLGEMSRTMRHAADDLTERANRLDKAAKAFTAVCSEATT